MSDPALALVEFDSIARGIVAGDAMIKTAPLGSIYAGTVHPGKYLVLVSGDTASVEVALETGMDTGGDSVLDSVFLADVHPAVVAAVVISDDAARLVPEALGIVETATVATVLDAADAGVKAADVTLSAVRLADGLGGKGYALLSGAVAEVEASMVAALGRAEQSGALVRHELVSQLHPELAANLASDLRFMARARLRPVE
ncbi:MAG: BMC domain-containing protein, partial [Acidimicrobiia bacterium]